MTQEEQRIAIAEACGARIDERGSFHVPTGRSLLLPTWWEAKKITVFVPDYTNDLNAMHEAEKTLGSIKVRRYVSELWSAMCQDGVEDEMDIGTIHATAAQRAEAFLRTIGKWKD